MYGKEGFLPRKNNIIDRVESRIHTVRGQRVMLDSDLAVLYGVTTKSVVRAIKRNPDRFPDDFMYQLTNKEVTDLRSQFVTSKKGRGGRMYLPYVFTEQGVAMLSSVLNSNRAIHVNIQIMRAFVKLREFALTHKELYRRLDDLEKKYDSQFQVVFKAIKLLLDKSKNDLDDRPRF